MPKIAIEDKEQKENLIIDAAEVVFFSKGYHNSSVEDICKQAKIAKGTVYLYFKSKKDLYYAIGSRALNCMYDMFLKSIQTDINGHDKVIALGRAYADYSIKYPNYYSFVIEYQKEMINYRTVEPEVIEAYKLSKKLFSIVVKAVQEGLDDGSIKTDFDALTLSSILWCQTSGVLQLSKLKESFFKSFGKVDTNIIIDSFIEYTSRALEKD